MRFQKTMFRVWCFVFRLLMKLLLRVEVHHLSELPEKGPLIVATNHFHLLDPAVVLAGVSYEYMTALVAKKWEQIWPINWIVKSFGGVFIRRGSLTGAPWRNVRPRCDKAASWDWLPREPAVVLACCNVASRGWPIWPSKPMPLFCQSESRGKTE